MIFGRKSCFKLYLVLWLLVLLKLIKKSREKECFRFFRIRGMSVDAFPTHRRERVTTSGGELGRLNIVNGAEIAPLRRWPGDLCLSRSTGGDVDAEEFIISVPHLSDAGGKLIIASDGIWDASAANCCRGSPAELAARRDGHLNLSFLRSVEPAWFLAPSESESAHAASIFSAGSKPWQGAVAPSSLFLHKHPHRFRIFLLGCCHYFSMGCMIISLYLHLH
ncbi:PP2Cc [Musa troglodytarum]|uniref:protein-serine/threonine phosphatase n=1 Tax=Musa troglodytarum TaxID=320322 RepID=A0A9E7HFU5_9LILI|nr:PP2Cc [Musa troglodytarum]